jgi:hypothetical protein
VKNVIPFSSDKSEGQLPRLSFLLISLSVFDLIFENIAEVEEADDVII